MWGNVLQGAYKSLLWMDSHLKTKVWMLVTVIWETRVIEVGRLFASVSWWEEYASSSSVSLAALALFFSSLFLFLASSSALAKCGRLLVYIDEKRPWHIISWFKMTTRTSQRR